MTQVSWGDLLELVLKRKEVELAKVELTGGLL